MTFTTLWEYPLSNHTFQGSFHGLKQTISQTFETLWNIYLSIYIYKNKLYICMFVCLWVCIWRHYKYIRLCIWRHYNYIRGWFKEKFQYKSYNGRRNSRGQPIVETFLFGSRVRNKNSKNFSDMTKKISSQVFITYNSQKHIKSLRAYEAT